MRSKLLVGGLVAAGAVMVAATPTVVEAAGQIGSAQIKNNSVKSVDLKDNGVKGVDVKESTLGTVPSAKSLAVAPSGYTQSGIFSAASSSTGNEGGWLGYSVNYQRPLATPIPNANIIDTSAAPNPALCPGVGQAAQGYLCLYFNTRSGVGTAYGYSQNANVLVGGRSIGVVGYIPVTGGDPYAGGVWTATAP